MLRNLIVVECLAGGSIEQFKTHLYCTSTSNLESWTLLTTLDVWVPGFGTYQSKLVVLGGLEGIDHVFDKVLTSKDGTIWETSLPPLPTPRCGAIVVSVGEKPEYLVVAGGYSIVRKDDTTIQ